MYKRQTLALERGKTVVTANKVAFALHWHELQKAAKQSGAGLYYEAAVCGAIPIIHTLEESLQANRISYIYGIVNGTTNYILTLSLIHICGARCVRCSTSWKPRKDCWVPCRFRCR